MRELEGVATRQRQASKQEIAHDVRVPLQVESLESRGDLTLGVRELVIAGWTARDRGVLERHLEELASLGVARPVRTPLYYRASAARLTTASRIEVIGTESSGEVEFLLLGVAGRVFVGVGSDHTDRRLESYGVSVAKQVCEKPIASVVWPFEEVAEHWDELVLRSFITVDGERHSYQQGEASAILRPRELWRGYTGSDSVPEGVVLFGGTIPSRGGVRTAERFEGELVDPLLGRSLRFGYDIAVLPDLG